jgi:uncharacterized membrane protein YeaQ/YmgE (transglycosylase-associated protein family)
MIIGVVGWIVVGLLVGFIASKFVNLHGDDPLGGIGVAAIAAVIFAAAYTVISGDGVSALNLWSIVFAAIGAIVAVVTWHLVRSRYVSREVQTSRRSY